MRNRWGIEIKKGYHAWARYPIWGTSRNQEIDGTIVKVDRSSDYAKAYGPQVTIRARNGDETEVQADMVTQVLPPMRVGRGGVVRANPAEIHIDVDSHNEHEGNPTPRLKRYDQPSQRARISERTGRPTKTPSKRLKQRRLMTHHEAPPGVWANPLTRVKLKSPAQRPAGQGEVPEKGSRLYERRKTTQKAPPGFYANPLPAFPYRVESRAPNATGWLPRGSFRTLNDAKQYARAFANANPEKTVRVVTSDTPPFSRDKHLRSVK